MPVQRIAVIGESRSGKTSLIDTLLGYSALPREQKTMKNVEIKLVHSPDLSSPTIEFEEGNESKRFTNIEEAKKHLKEKQSKATDADIDEKIKMVISSNQSADLTIIDTIGIDERKTQSLEVVKRTILDSTTLIILVMNASLLTDENVQLRDKWFRLVREVDCDLERTICVFTHCDRLPTNFNYNKIKQFLRDSNEILNLKYGFICCKANFSASMGGSDLSHFEKEYFSSHKVFQFMSINEYFTIDTLGERITKFICDSYQFKKNISYMYQQLKEKIEKNEKELAKFGTDYLEFTNQSKDLYLQSLMNLFCETVDRTFSGKAEFEMDNVANTNLKKIYVDFLVPYLDYHPSKVAKNECIIKIIQQTEGAQISGFPSGDVVYSLLDDSIETLRQEIKAYLDGVYLVVNDLIKGLIGRIFGRFPKALNDIEELILGFLEQEFNKTKKIILNIAEMNFNYLYIDEMSNSYQNLLKTTLLKDFQGQTGQGQQGQHGQQGQQGQNKQGQQGNNQANNQNTQNNIPFKRESEISFFKSAKDKDSYYKSLADYCKALIDYIYAEIIRNLREYLPKATGNFYIKSLKTNMRFYLLSYISKNPQFVESLEEDQEQAEKRSYYVETTKTLKKIMKQISYDDSLMKIVKGDNMKSVDNIVQQQLKTDLSRNKSSDNVKATLKDSSNKPPTTPTSSQQAQAKSTTSMLFGTGKQHASTSNQTHESRPQQKPTNSMGSFLNNNDGKQSFSQQQNQQKNVPPQQQKKDQKGLDVNFKYDPTTNQIKDVKLSGEVDYKTAKAIYDNNKQYLPTGAQIASGAKSAYNFAGKMAEESNKEEGGQKKGIDPLSSLFGTGKKKGAF